MNILGTKNTTGTTWKSTKNLHTHIEHTILRMRKTPHKERWRGSHSRVSWLEPHELYTSDGRWHEKTVKSTIKYWMDLHFNHFYPYFFPYACPEIVAIPFVSNFTVQNIRFPFNLMNERERAKSDLKENPKWSVVTLSNMSKH